MTTTGSEEIMRATYTALCEFGYADLTMQDIADNTDKSKATLHYHYDSKHALLLEFLDHLYEKFTERVNQPTGNGPTEELVAFIDLVMTPPEPDEHSHEEFGTAMLELKAQAPYDTGIRDRMQQFDDFMISAIRESLIAGMDAGEIRDIDPDTVARFLVTSITGARTNEVAIGQNLAATHQTLLQYIETHLLTSEKDGMLNIAEVEELR